jgi:hypothetical protein
MKFYSSDIEHKMQLFYESLSEKERRRYAAVETMKLPGQNHKETPKWQLVLEI